MSSVRRRATPKVTRVTLAVITGGAALLAGCSGSDQSSPAPTTAPSAVTESPTHLAELDTTALVVGRAPFCDSVDPDAVARALGGEGAAASAYRSGQRIEVRDDVADVVHEFGCRWRAGDNRAAAWVFAPPVTRERARLLAESATGPDCLDYVGVAEFGRPTAHCAQDDGGTFSVRYQGLFGDAWLTCSLSIAGQPDAKVDERASHWCAAVATSAAS